MDCKFRGGNYSHDILNSIHLFSSIVKDATLYFTNFNKVATATESQKFKTENANIDLPFNTPNIHSSNLINSTTLNMSDRGSITSNEVEISNGKDSSKTHSSNLDEFFLDNSRAYFKYNKKTTRHKKVLWKRREELQLIDLVEKYGENFDLISQYIPGRSPEDIKDKYYSKLNPLLSKNKFTPEEDQKIVNMHKKFGNHWNIIAQYFPNRNSNNIKNRFYSFLRNKSLSTNTRVLSQQDLPNFNSNILFSKHDLESRFLNLKTIKHLQYNNYLYETSKELFSDDKREVTSSYLDNSTSVNLKNEDFCFNNSKYFEVTEIDEINSNPTYYENQTDGIEKIFLFYKYKALDIIIRKIVDIHRTILEGGNYCKKNFEINQESSNYSKGFSFCDSKIS
jgi:hypothetical protein